MTKLHYRVRIGKRGTIVIPKNVRKKLGLAEGMSLELSVEGDRIILKTEDLWINLRERGKNLKVNLDEAERELDEADESWAKRLTQ